MCVCKYSHIMLFGLRSSPVETKPFETVGADHVSWPRFLCATSQSAVNTARRSHAGWRIVQCYLLRFMELCPKTNTE